MDALVELIAILAIHWRVGLLTLISLVIAVFLAAALSWFTGWYGIMLVLLGLGVGMCWEDAQR
ncbi:hypothetical protein [Paracidovorax konjaci]|uniref:hypothetical protein n=1 Tax=Paracidovorax konjaci TaxID=32040 RepID=UPI000B852B05|nr:hypothetical protein [Paracidovorax konjaci]